MPTCPPFSTIGAPQPRGRRRNALFFWLGRVLGGCLALGLVLALAGYTYEALAEAHDARASPPAGRMVEVGGHRLHLHFTGVGSPTVVTESGIDLYGSLAWSAVQPATAQTTRVCSYDRAGYAWSEPGPAPRTSRQIVMELHTLLVNAGIEGPYVLVGHSFGGMPVRLYASQYPGEVVGLVLVDVRHEDFGARVAAEAKAVEAFQLQQARIGQYLARVGLLRLADLANCQGAAPFFPTDVQARARVACYRPEGVRTAYREQASLPESEAQMRASGSLGSLPLVVLTATAGNAPDTVAGRHGDQLWQELQVELVKLSSRSTHVLAPTSHHHIQLEQPTLVIDAVRQVVEATRTP